MAGLGAMAAVARATATPLATNMCVVETGDLPEAFSRGSVAIVLLDHHYWGGLRASRTVSDACAWWGVSVSMHSNSHLGISLAAMVHLAAVVPTLPYALDTHTPWLSGHDVVSTPLALKDGAVAVPQGPGLGVELDRDALGRMHEAYLSCGIRTRDDIGYFRTCRDAGQPVPYTEWRSS